MPDASERTVPSRRESRRSEPMAFASAGRRALEGIVQTLCAPTLSLDALRGAVVRYGRAARDLALAPEEMTGTLLPLVRRCAGERAPARMAELQRYVQWWAIHGYHGTE